MDVRLVTQPYSEGLRLQDFVALATRDARCSQFEMVVAWVLHSGVSVVRPAIDAFRERGGVVRVIAGISLGGTSRQGLEDIIEMATDGFVFHLPGRTFHPKVYLATGDEWALALIGSHNLTRGGTMTNFEAGVVAELDLSAQADAAFYASLREFIDGLTEDSAVCRKLDAHFLEELISSGRYPLADESAEGGTRWDRPPPDPSGTGAELFGASQRSLGVGPARAAAQRLPSEVPLGATTTQGAPRGSSANSPGRMARRWFKKLRAADAQQLVGGHPSNTMTLVAAGHPVPTDSYFRDVFFGDASWEVAASRSGRAREVAEIECEIEVLGKSHGSEVFTIRHTPDYDSGQNNRTTELVWGEFGHFLRANDLTEHYAVLERTTDGRSRLIIAEEPPGPFQE